MKSTNDTSLMRRALDLARRGPIADPNPRVGAVVVTPDGEIVGEGFHAGTGTPHAEVGALAQAGAMAKGATAYVSLEPCDHTGRTGPCSRALISAGVRRVVYAQSDSNRHAAGGADRLRSAGIVVTAGVLVDEALDVNRIWTFAIEHGRPYVTWKYAATLDGFSAAVDGTSRWITGYEARADVHRLRAEAGAVLVGTGTVLTDDPHLTVRRPDGTITARQPRRVVMGRREIPAGARILDSSAETLQLTHRDPAAALATLSRLGVRHVWLEGGPTLAAAFVMAGLVDEVVAYLAPVLLGSGRSALGDLGVTTLDGALRLTPYDFTSLGPDLRVRATLTASSVSTTH